MKIYVQWALRQARDWQLRDSSEWATLPRKADQQNTGPVANNVLDNNPGWLLALNVQGVEFVNDHTVVEDLNDGSGGIRVTVWSDNPTTSPPGFREAQVWTFLPLAPDSRFGGALNTRQSRVVYPEAGKMADWASPPELTTVRTWAEFLVPSTPAVHGIWVSDATWNAHIAARTQHGWREW